MTKLAGEQLCRVYHVNHGLETVALRFFTVYGPRQRPDMAFRRFCEAAARGGSIELFGDGRQSRDFTYVGDVVGAIRAAGSAEGAGGRAYNVGGGSPISLNARARAARRDRRAARSTCRRAERESGDVLHTAADVSAGARGARLRARRRASPPACGRSTSGCSRARSGGRGWRRSARAPRERLDLRQPKA